MSDLISVECPNCEAKLTVREPGDESKRVRGPKCEESLVVEPP